MAHHRIELDNLNTTAISIIDRDGVTRFTITADNHLETRCISLSINVWDADNYGTTNEKHRDVAVSYNQKERRDAFGS